MGSILSGRQMDKQLDRDVISRQLSELWQDSRQAEAESGRVPVR